MNRRYLVLVASACLTKGSGMVAGAESPSDVQMRTVGRQTLGFELPQLPGEEFRIAIPELISDKTQAILPWGFASPDFEIEKNLAQLHIEVPGRVRMEAKILSRR